MNKIIIACLLAFVSNVQAFTVYVLLDKKTEDGVLWKISSQKGFLVNDPQDAERQDQLKVPRCTIKAKQSVLSVNGKKLASQGIVFAALDGSPLTVDKGSYTGSLLVLFDKDVWYLVNAVDLEEYIYSVLRSESFPSWPLEINMAFAIMQRSYVVEKIMKARGKKKLGKGFLYDIGCTNLDQTYKGTHTFENLWQAVDGTRGVVLAYNKKPIVAMYDVCCGGLVPAKMRGHDFTGSPYLGRDYACTHCSDCKVYSWRASYTLDECTELFRDAGLTTKAVTGMKVAEIDKAGVVHSLQVKLGKKWKTFPRKTIYNLFKDVKSYSFDVWLDEGTLNFDGRGYGHHLGLCQWGARQMVKKGCSYQEVLEFYYPGTTFMKVV